MQGIIGPPPASFEAAAEREKQADALRRLLALRARREVCTYSATACARHLRCAGR